jgi:predicted RNA binding protein YcfA (HicA-like mRNA interferase family)
MPSISRRELIRRLRALGFDGAYSGGRHQFMIRGRQKLRIPNPHHQEIDMSLVNELLRQAGISRDEWEEAGS